KLTRRLGDELPHQLAVSVERWEETEKILVIHLSILVERDGQRYQVESHTVIEAPLEAVYGVLSDYDHLHELSTAFEETRVVEGADSPHDRLVYLRARGCVAFFCRTIERYDRLALTPPQEISAVAVAPPQDTPDAKASPIPYSRSHWRLTEEVDGTHVYYSLEMEPPFWVPPLVGPWAVKRKLARGAEDAAQRVEQRALGLPVTFD
ncbi:MAG: SRPBCC family protein, partial [Pseudomonadota bacterium]